MDDSGLSFFKAISADETTAQKLKLPPGFGFQMQSPTSSAFVLRDRYKNFWPVEVTRIDNHWYFDKGWTKFSEDNSLEPNDCLVFEYKGKNVFDVVLYGENACQKVGALPRGFELKQEQDEDEEEECGKKSRRKEVGSTSGKRASKIKKATDRYGDDIFESGQVSRPENPYFVTRSRLQRRKNALLIPKDLNVYLPEIIPNTKKDLQKKLYIVDRKGNKWETEIKQWKDGRVHLTKGWLGFCNANGVKWDDTCICEIVRATGNNDHYILAYAVDASEK